MPYKRSNILSPLYGGSSACRDYSLDKIPSRYVFRVISLCQFRASRRVVCNPFLSPLRHL
jgi:hypothetical protein